MKIERIDHIVLTVMDIEETCRFYSSVLGMKRVNFGGGRVALHFGNQKIKLHQVDKPVDVNVLHATRGAADICLVTDSTINEILKTLSIKNIKLIEGPCTRTGAMGVISSVYFYDPDENLIEVSTYK